MINALLANKVANSVPYELSDDGGKIQSALSAIEEAVSESANRGLFQTHVHLNIHEYYDYIYSVSRFLQDQGYEVDLSINAESGMYDLSLKWRSVLL